MLQHRPVAAAQAQAQAKAMHALHATAAPLPPAATMATPPPLQPRLVRTALSLLARQVPSPSAAGPSSSSVSSSSHPSYSHGADRHVVQSEVHDMSADQLLRYNNTSGITINAIIAVISVLVGVFLFCILLSVLLSRTNAPRHEAYPYTHSAMPPKAYQPSAFASPRRDRTPSSPSTFDQKAKLLDSPVAPAGGWPHPIPHSGLAAAQYQDRTPSPSSMSGSDAFPFSPPPTYPGIVNYNGREMAISMAAPEAEEVVRQTADMRLERERARRSTVVVGGPPPLRDARRSSRSSRASMLGPGSHLPTTVGSRAQRTSRQRLSRFSRLSHVPPPTAAGTAQRDDPRGGGVPREPRRRSVTSTGAGISRTGSSICLDTTQPGGYVFGGRRGLPGRRESLMDEIGPQASRVLFGPPAPRKGSARTAAHTPYHDRNGSTLTSGSMGSSFIAPSLYDVNGRHQHGHEQEWDVAHASEIDLLDPLQANGPNPFRVARR